MKLAVVFFIAFIISGLGLQGLSHFLSENQKINEFKQNHIILEDIKFRFHMFLNLQISIANIGSEYFSEGNIETKTYGPLTEKLLSINPNIMGFNLVDTDGKIVKVFPLEKNIRALNQTSQNTKEIHASYQRGEPMWFSPPFPLYQGEQGFIIYYPIVKDKVLRGWFATVVGTQLFKNDFDVKEFLQSYNLIILDNQTRKPFYSTTFLPDKNIQTFSTEGLFHGREISFIIWRKFPHQTLVLPLSWVIVGAVLISALVALTFQFYEQKKRARGQLDDVSMLLNLTSKEALSKLIDLQKEIYKVGNSENAEYITNLIEQIDLLQSTANSLKGIEQESVAILPVIMSELSDSEYLIQKKGIKIKFNPEKLKNLEIETNPYLFKKSVIGSILTYVIIHSDQGTGITIDCGKNFSRHVLTFHSERIYQLDKNNQYINLDRRIEVARKILSLSEATIHIDYDLAGGMIVRIEFPLTDTVK